MRLRRPPRTTLLLAASVLAAACGTPGARDTAGRTDSPPPSTQMPSPGATETPAPSSPPANGLRIEISVGGRSTTGTLRDTAASRDLLTQLPLTLSMRDFASVEKVGELPARLATTAEPAGADPSVGDIGYYAPWNNFVLFYGDQSYHEGIVVLGRIDNGLDLIQHDRGMEVTITRID
jgi:hypothetical protein